MLTLDAEKFEQALLNTYANVEYSFASIQAVNVMYRSPMFQKAVQRGTVTSSKVSLENALQTMLHIGFATGVEYARLLQLKEDTSGLPDN